MAKELPGNWVLTDLMDVASVYTGKKDANFSSSTGMYPFFTCAFEPLRAGSYSFEGDVLILPGNGANVGEVFYYSGKFEAYQRTYIIGSIQIHPKYLYYFFKTYWKTLGVSEQYGSATNYIKIGNFKNFQIKIAPLSEQNRIVEKLNKLFEQLENINKSLEKIPLLLKNFRQQVLTQAVTGKLTAEWRSGKELGERKNSTIGELFEVKTGATPKRGNAEYYKNATIPWLKSGQVRNELIYNAEEFITEKAINETNAKIFPENTLLVAMYGEGKTRGQVGWMKIAAATNQAIAALVNNIMENVTRSYVYYFCLSQYNEIRAKAEGGNQPNLNLTKIKNWELELPSIQEQQAIVARVESLFSKADAIQEKYEILKAKTAQLPQAILHQAFQGKLVPQLESDGDAKELLKEIEALKQESNTKTKKAKPKKYKTNEVALRKAAEEASDYKK